MIRSRRWHFYSNLPTINKAGIAVGMFISLYLSWSLYISLLFISFYICLSRFIFYLFIFTFTRVLSLSLAYSRAKVRASERKWERKQCVKLYVPNFQSTSSQLFLSPFHLPSIHAIPLFSLFLSYPTEFISFRQSMKGKHHHFQP
jgi:hypothetical protein